MRRYWAKTRFELSFLTVFSCPPWSRGFVYSCQVPRFQAGAIFLENCQASIGRIHTILVSLSVEYYFLSTTTKWTANFIPESNKSCFFLPDAKIFRGRPWKGINFVDYTPTDPMSNWPNVWLTQWSTDPMSNWPNVWLTQWSTDPMSNWPNVKLTQCPTDPMSNWPNVWLTQWSTDPMSNWPNVKLTQCPTDPRSNWPNVQLTQLLIKGKQHKEEVITDVGGGRCYFHSGACS